MDNSGGGTGAVYKGLAIGQVGGQTFIFATNFRDGVVEVSDSSFSLVTSKFITDAAVPAGFAPFGIENINGKLYITFAKQKPGKHDDEAGAGNGFVDVFDLKSGTLTRFVSGGVLNSPWGLALAPKDFGKFSHHLLIGNFGDGKVNAFDVSSGESDGPLKDLHGQPIIIGGLWGLRFGGRAKNSAGQFINGPANSLFFTAGIGDEMHGLFGTITLFRGCNVDSDGR